MKTLVLIPHYNHPAAIARVAQTMHGFGLDVLIVDDGSREDQDILVAEADERLADRDRKSTRLNSSNRSISYAVFCMKK